MQEAIHIYNSLKKANSTSQKLQKSMSCQRTQKMMMMKESQQRTI